MAAKTPLAVGQVVFVRERGDGKDCAKRGSFRRRIGPKAGLCQQFLGPTTGLLQSDDTKPAKLDVPLPRSEAFACGWWRRLSRRRSRLHARIRGRHFKWFFGAKGRSAITLGLVFGNRIKAAIQVPVTLTWRHSQLAAPSVGAARRLRTDRGAVQAPVG